jgi:hypothetical protein
MIPMAATRIIEEERGACAGRAVHHHNGYYAGDFSRVPITHPGAATPAAQLPRTS